MAPSLSIEIRYCNQVCWFCSASLWLHWRCCRCFFFSLLIFSKAVSCGIHSIVAVNVVLNYSLFLPKDKT